MGVRNFDELAAEFLAVEKIAPKRSRWRTKAHPDYAVASIPVGVHGSRSLRGVITLTSHRLVERPKYGFVLLFRGQRVLGLDVNPGRDHRNLLVPARIGGTHWHRWPNIGEAVEDDRSLAFGAWLHEFLKSANVTVEFQVLSPPRGVQLELGRWRDS